VKSEKGKRLESVAAPATVWDDEIDSVSHWETGKVVESKMKPEPGDLPDKYGNFLRREGQCQAWPVPGWDGTIVWWNRPPVEIPEVLLFHNK